MLSTTLLNYTFVGCSKSEPVVKEATSNPLQLKHLSMPAVLNLSKGNAINIIGTGFKEKDIISFSPRSGQGTIIDLSIKEFNDKGITLDYSDALEDGKYDITIKRESTSQLIGKTVVNHVLRLDIPDKPNMTVKGIVHTEGKGIANVLVTDGEIFTKTDADGIYYLPSSKKNGVVYITIPSNYQVARRNTVPQFFKLLTGITSESEIRDFEIKPLNTQNHAIAFLADIHLANRNDDIKQFQENFLKDIQETSEYYRAQNKQFYALTLGDQSWDAYWYDNNFKIKEYLDNVKDLPFTIFNTIGNHDYNPYIAMNDFVASAEYRNILGPTYYSMNLGNVHYVILDNVVYTNTGGNNGIIGDREYDNIVTPEQVKWLQTNLSFIEDKSKPVVVVMHVPLYSNPTSGSNYATKNGQEIVDALAGFTNVKIMSGHTHINYRVNKLETPHISEENIGAVSATWWWTGRSGYADNHICKDGSPGGYSIMEAEGSKTKSYYKGIGFAKEYQFRTYDLNNVLITSETHAPKANATYKAKTATYAGEYTKENKKNEVLLNVWGYNKNWKITVKENGKELEVKQTTKKDPLHIISYAMQRLNVNAEPTSSFISGNTSHLFLVTASSPKSTLEIMVEDEYGNIYEETMTRPKAFSYSMR
ncbi:hypothetical protein M472_12755 [Sphingobacterium paucimobilis HER1398]|uniref:Metallophosphoesterase n=1 Tax=Sphingobacterium paucimobilis HER1398 TaxID=1346330 RepID=U2JAH0_9SPHI|nr:hypothetical protein M472_12755 [Sphingobacterium paucimobilis HER1398]